MSNDPREQPLNDVARKIMVRSNYDPHFSGIEERVIMETALFLARYDALQGLRRLDIPDDLRSALTRLKEARTFCMITEIDGETVISGISTDRKLPSKAICDLDDAIEAIIKLAP